MEQELNKQSPELQFSAITKQVEELANQCRTIVIKTDDDYAILRQKLSSVNNLKKIIEEKRKDLKQPHLEAGKKIDEIAKKITNPLDEALKAGNHEVIRWDNIIEEKRKEDERKAAEIAKQKQDKLDKIRNSLKKTKEDIETKLQLVTTEPQLIAFKDKISKVWPDHSMYGELSGLSEQTLNYLLSLCEQKRQWIVSPPEAKQAIAEEAREMKVESEQFIQEVTEQAKVDAVIETKMAVAIDNLKVDNIRKTWKWEVVDINAMPPAWKQTIANAAELDLFLKTNKENLNSGEIIQGVKFFQEKSVVNRS